ncbi:hypothetical protein [Chengkuizengella sediminis]|uniref:hypothetical protein n=1 Tax=Chengkuizengella sediminis TaxID=1885917 RepID=UPI00147819A7|nr:hypothetical protein [Chengkuizengella sediminis]
MLQWLKNLFAPKKCAICGKQAIDARKYYNDTEEPVVVCRNCTEYAERRAFRKRS